MLDFPLLLGPKTKVMGFRGICCSFAPNALKFARLKDWSEFLGCGLAAVLGSFAIRVANGDDTSGSRCTCKCFDNMLHDSRVMSSFTEQKGLSLDRLQTLCLVAEKGGVMAAAGGNPNRQSLFSRQLRELEAFFGAPLIDRRQTPHSLTELGRKVEKSARGFFSDLEGLAQIGPVGQVAMTIGAGESVIQSILIPSLVTKSQVGLKFVFRNLQGSAILAGLRNRRLDLGIAHDSGGHADLKSKRLLRHGVRLITRDAKLGKLPSVSWAELDQVSLALPEGDSELRKTVDAGLAAQRNSPVVALECTSHAQILEAVGCSKIAGVVPDFVAQRAQERGLYSLPIKELAGYSRELRVLWHPAAVEMKPQILECVRDLLASVSKSS